MGVAQRASDDCGVACLATLTGRVWLVAAEYLFPALTHPKSWATSETRMRRGMSKLGWKLSRKRGVPIIEGERGLIESRTALEFGWTGHWLAWERNPDGRVWVWNPQCGGELFEYKPGALHNRGLRLTWWANMTRKER